MNPKLVLNVVRFELRRSLSIGRITIWTILVLFPVALVATVRLFGEPGGQSGNMGADTLLPDS